MTTTNWKPTPLDLDWCSNLYSKLHMNGVWTFSTGEFGGEMTKSRASFTKRNGVMVLTDVSINLDQTPDEIDEDRKMIFDRITMSKICMEVLGIDVDTNPVWRKKPKDGSGRYTVMSDKDLRGTE